jgi:hypothetical protein
MYALSTSWGEIGKGEEQTAHRQLDYLCTYLPLASSPFMHVAKEVYRLVNSAVSNHGVPDNFLKPFIRMTVISSRRKRLLVVGPFLMPGLVNIHGLAMNHLSYSLKLPISIFHEDMRIDFQPLEIFSRRHL